MQIHAVLTLIKSRISVRLRGPIRAEGPAVWRGGLYRELQSPWNVFPPGHPFRRQAIRLTSEKPRPTDWPFAINSRIPGLQILGKCSLYGLRDLIDLSIPAQLFNFFALFRHLALSLRVSSADGGLIGPEKRVRVQECDLAPLGSCRNPLVCIVRYTSSCGVNPNSPGFDAQSVVHCDS